MTNSKLNYVWIAFASILLSFSTLPTKNVAAKSFLDAYCNANDQICTAELMTEPTVQTVEIQLTDLLNRVLESKTIRLADGVGSVQFSTKDINSRFAVVRCKIGEEWLRKKVSVRE